MKSSFEVLSSSVRTGAHAESSGAIVGGLLTGGISLIAGGAIGGRKKGTSLAGVTCLVDRQESDVYLQADKDDFGKISNMLI
ncbi:hypothetical protein NYE40_00690 [Paenibacillus sp. FSL W8-1187]|uniref:hypothetical protein n=1 Tax=Paenibacillus sp. FSL W8-1187 TaxID=2975339 RepID=UPI0030D7AD41